MGASAGISLDTDFGDGWNAAPVFFGALIDSIGGADRDRTDDLLNAIQALSHLSYGPTEPRSIAKCRSRGQSLMARHTRAMTEAREIYVHGHHDSVLRSHTWRNAENSAAYLLPHLRSGMDLLDVGCGPGTITVELAQRVAPGSVVGLDREIDVLDKARSIEDGHRCRFVEGDVYSLDFPDESFDVVHAHQVLQHLREPVAALREMTRVARRGGVIAVRDADYGGMFWEPSEPLLDRWLELYQAITAANEVEADAGRKLPSWTRVAGLSSCEVTSSTWTFRDPEQRAWWADLWAERVTSSSYATLALEARLSSREELEQIAAAWRRWAQRADAVFVVPHVEVLGRAG